LFSPHVIPRLLVMIAAAQTTLGYVCMYVFISKIQGTVARVVTGTRTSYQKDHTPVVSLRS
jgi:hypothetical protein